MSQKHSHAKVEELFLQCSSATGTADFFSLAKLFWPILDNKISIVDLAGMFAMAIPAHVQTDSLDAGLFIDVFNAIAKLKYPTGKENGDKLLEDLKNGRHLILPEHSFFEKCMEKNVIRSLLRFDIPLRRCYCNFAGKAVSIGGGVTWEEVKRLNLGMEVFLTIITPLFTCMRL